MQFTLPNDCNCAPRRALSGLGYWWVPLAQTAMQQAGKKDGGGAEGGMPSINVATQVTSNINPQISPQFIQQDQPQDSPIIAGVSMGQPGSLPQTGFMPGFDNILPQLSEYTHNINKPLLYGSFALLGLAIAAKVYMKRQDKKAVR